MCLKPLFQLDLFASGCLTSLSAPDSAVICRSLPYVKPPKATVIMTDIGYTLFCLCVSSSNCRIPRPAVSRSEMKLLFKLGALKPDAFENSAPRQELIEKLVKIWHHQLGPTSYRYCLDFIN